MHLLPINSNKGFVKIQSNSDNHLKWQIKIIQKIFVITINMKNQIPVATNMIKQSNKHNTYHAI